MSKNPDSQEGADLGALEARRLESIEDWVKTHVGGRVDEIERLERWRPVWRVDYSKDGEKKALLVRGDRPCTTLYSLRHEMLVMEALEANGIPVPHIHGWMDFPKAFVMDWAEGDRDPGMIHTAIENATSMSPERWAASLKYVEVLARMHAIPVSEFSEIEGIRPVGAREIATSQLERQYAVGVEANAIDSTIEYMTSWCRRNVPEHRTEGSFITGDAGQFLCTGDEISAVIEFEIAHIGDIFMDLSCFRGRHPYENMGDIPALFRHYAKVSGVELDLRVIGYHTACYLTFATIAANMFMDPESQDSNWIEGILEYASIARRVMEAIAELEGIELDYDLHLPEAHVTPVEDSAIEKLLLEIDRLPTSNTFLPWQRDLMADIPRFLLNQAHYGRWYEDETLRDISELTGKRPENLAAAENDLKAYIDVGDPARDKDLVQLVHRRMLRLSMVIAGSDPTDDNPLFFKLEPILNMETR